MTSLEKAVVALRTALTRGTDIAAPFNVVIDAGHDAPVPAKDAAIRALLDRTGVYDPEHIGYLAVASGALVEQGGSATESLGVVLGALADGVDVLAGPALEEADLDRSLAPAQLTSRERSWVRAYSRVVVGAMARLARSVEACVRARAHPRLDGAVRALGKRLHAWHLVYVREVLDMLDDAPLVVVDVATGRVTRFRATGVRSNFHLPQRPGGTPLRRHNARRPASDRGRTSSPTT